MATADLFSCVYSGGSMSIVNRAIVGVLLLSAIGAAVWVVFWYKTVGIPLVKIDPLAVLVVVTTVAVGIERGLEYMWSVVELFAGSFWPFTAIAKHVESLTDQLDSAATPFLVHSLAAVTFLTEKKAIADTELSKLADPLARAAKDLGALKQSASGSQRIASFAAAANDQINAIAANYAAIIDGATKSTANPADRLLLAKAIIAAEAVTAERKSHPNLSESELKDRAEKATALWEETLSDDTDKRDIEVKRFLENTQFGRLQYLDEVAGTALSGIGDFLGSFKDNPGRRIVSIQIAVIAGIIIAGLGGISIFAGVQNEGAKDANMLVDPTITGILMTGLIMGLGSSPTHEIIKVLQENKKRGKGLNAPKGGVASRSPNMRRLAAGSFSIGLVAPKEVTTADTTPAEAPPPPPWSLTFEEPVELHFR